MVRLFLILFTAAAVVYPQEFKVKAFTDTTAYMIGDYINLHFSVEHQKGYSFAEPQFRDSISNIDIIGINDPVVKENGNSVITNYNIVLSRYDSSDIRIPPITFYYWKGGKKDRAAFLIDKLAQDSTVKSVKSNEVFFRVNAVKVNVQEDIKDVKQPLKIPPDWRLILLYILAGLILAGAAFYIYLKIQRKREALKSRQIVYVPPHVAALSSLNELEKKNLWQKGFVKEFHSEVTGIIRKYFEERFGFPSLEMTTGETIELLNKTEEAKSVIDDSLDFLNNADLVKFAKFIPMNDVNEMMLKKAYMIVERTIPAEQSENEVSNVG